MFVCVLNKNKEPLDMCHPAKARKLLKRGKAVVHKRYPFVIRLKEKKETVSNHSYEAKIDPGSKITGLTITKGNNVVVLSELHHKKGISEELQSRNSLRRGRRGRKTRYRRCKFPNQKGQTSSFTTNRPRGWLAPSLGSRISQTENLLRKLMRFIPIDSLALELVKFDTQKLENPEIKGVEYQQGELNGYEVREYLLEKWGRKCAYCHEEDVPLEVEHIEPRSKGGSDRVSNLTLACRPCNEEKGSLFLSEWLEASKKKKSKRYKTISSEIPKVLRKRKQPLKDASAVNATRWALYNKLKNRELPLYSQSGAKTKMQRIKSDLPKEHYYDALCVGDSLHWNFFTDQVLEFHATGRGNRQMARVDKYGFPKQHTHTEKYDKKGKRKGHRERKKLCNNVQTGDIVYALVPTGKKQGTYFGRVSIRHNGFFNIKNHLTGETIQGVSWKHCQVVHRNDGWDYKRKSRAVSSHG
ncbi:HNH endonuclease (plasmid) [Pontibacillus sp. ALD_SL1]|uniref:RNA-guided endonuclease IscB n=1 Tax=Pontibacillus sp. ALD_SL1 TaxID=2777185 RepID=UPI001A97B11E|nr:RNA-guided endonuclease IscB [Pontibacillus sp. ALD_SL1]QST02541.1 HNH endonuclease [Pontibacillus sp. ALD_SL1]